MATYNNYSAQGTQGEEYVFASFPGTSRGLAKYAADLIDTWLSVAAGAGAALAAAETGPLSLVAGGIAYKSTKVFAHSIREKIYRDFVNNQGLQDTNSGQ
jgi:hypothetical protein